jgi:hypothetical protein
VPGRDLKKPFGVPFENGEKQRGEMGRSTRIMNKRMLLPYEEFLAGRGV